jgi:hypothetical protein|tara:strand:- start:499 stop:618 length:120 start_codon:yes stop_codon:yes gene_type:complete
MYNKEVLRNSNGYGDIYLVSDGYKYVPSDNAFVGVSLWG